MIKNKYLKIGTLLGILVSLTIFFVIGVIPVESRTNEQTLIAPSFLALVLQFYIIYKMLTILKAKNYEVTMGTIQQSVIKRRFRSYFTQGEGSAHPSYKAELVVSFYLEHTLYSTFKKSKVNESKEYLETIFKPEETILLYYDLKNPNKTSLGIFIDDLEIYLFFAIITPLSSIFGTIGFINLEFTLISTIILLITIFIGILTLYSVLYTRKLSFTYGSKIGFGKEQKNICNYCKNSYIIPVNEWHCDMLKQEVDTITFCHDFVRKPLDKASETYISNKKDQKLKKLICSECSNEIFENDVFCQNCGKPRS